MDYLFTPWRMAYIRSVKKDGCIFCEMLEQDDREGLILHRGHHAFLVLNRYPYNNGHFMSVPYRHVDTLELLSAQEMAEMMVLVMRGLAALRQAWNPEGFNIGANIGKVAGAGVKDHVHMHAVPRWAGDTNFMSLFAETRVIPQTLEETYDELKAVLASLDPERLDPERLDPERLEHEDAKGTKVTKGEGVQGVADVDGEL
jgi:ATP adenylyltransferase